MLWPGVWQDPSTALSGCGSASTRAALQAPQAQRPQQHIEQHAGAGQQHAEREDQAPDPGVEASDAADAGADAAEPGLAADALQTIGRVDGGAAGVARGGVVPAMTCALARANRRRSGRHGRAGRPVAGVVRRWSCWAPRQGDSVPAVCAPCPDHARRLRRIDQTRTDRSRKGNQPPGAGGGGRRAAKASRCWACCLMKVSADSRPKPRSTACITTAFVHGPSRWAVPNGNGVRHMSARMVARLIPASSWACRWRALAASSGSRRSWASASSMRWASSPRRRRLSLGGGRGQGADVVRATQRGWCGGSAASRAGATGPSDAATAVSRTASTDSGPQGSRPERVAARWASCRWARRAASLPEVGARRRWARPSRWWASGLASSSASVACSSGRACAGLPQSIWARASVRRTRSSVGYFRPK